MIYNLIGLMEIISLIGVMVGGWSGGNGILIWMGIGMVVNVINVSDIVIGNGVFLIVGNGVVLGINVIIISGSVGFVMGVYFIVLVSYGIVIGGVIGSGWGVVVEGIGFVVIGMILYVISGMSNVVVFGMGFVVYEFNIVFVGVGVFNIDGYIFMRWIVNVLFGIVDMDVVNVL